MKNRTQIQSLQEIQSKAGKKQTTVGIVVDATKPFKTANAEDFVTKLKVIDQSLNCRTPHSHHPGAKQLRKYLHVFIYTNTLQQAPTIHNLGDIIYLKRYDFSFYDFVGSDEQELKCLNRKYYSRYYLLNGYSDSVQTEMEIIQKDSEDDYEVNEILEEKVKGLRLFARDYFSKHSLQEMYLYGSTDIDQTRQEREDFDMVLKVKEKVKVQELESIVSLGLEDSQGHCFYVQCLEGGVEVGQVVEVRSINHIDYQRRLILNQYASIIPIPHYFKDHMHFHTLFNYSLQYTHHYKHILAQQLHYSTQGQQQLSYATDNAYYSVIKLKYNDLQETPLKEVHDLSLKQRATVESVGLKVVCRIYSVESVRLEDSLRKYCRLCNKMQKYTQENIKCCHRNNDNIINMKLTLTDQNNHHLVDAFIFTYDDNPYTIFKFLNYYKIDECSEEEFKALQKEYTNFVQQVTSNEDRLYQFILEPSKAENKVMFRIIDTFFI